jgi:hypothetical protein
MSGLKAHVTLSMTARPLTGPTEDIGTIWTKGQVNSAWR